MKNVKVILLAAVLLLITACGSRVPFKAQEPLNKAALVYIYVSPDSVFESNPYYKIRINNKRIDGKVKKDEYIALNLKPSNGMNISATRAEIDEKVINLNILAGQTYYFKIQGNGNGGFSFVRVANSVGSKEITKMGLAGSILEDTANSLVKELIETPKEDASAKPVVQIKHVNDLSKPDEVQKAYKLKEQGILTDAEYQKLKAEILAK